MIRIGSGIRLNTSNGGSLTLLQATDEVRRFGIDKKGWAAVDDLRFNPYNELSFDLAGKKTQTTIAHIGGMVVASFGLISQVPNATCDIEVLGLAPNEWYRLEFGDNLAQSDSGFAHSRTGENGEFMIAGVVIPDE
jgi:hypothetical protein